MHGDTAAMSSQLLSSSAVLNHLWGPKFPEMVAEGLQGGPWSLAPTCSQAWPQRSGVGPGASARQLLLLIGRVSPPFPRGLGFLFLHFFLSSLSVLTASLRTLALNTGSSLLPSLQCGPQPSDSVLAVGPCERDTPEQRQRTWWCKDRGQRQWCKEIIIYFYINPTPWSYTHTHR